MDQYEATKRSIEALKREIFELESLADAEEERPEAIRLKVEKAVVANDVVSRNAAQLSPATEPSTPPTPHVGYVSVPQPPPRRQSSSKVTTTSDSILNESTVALLVAEGFSADVALAAVYATSGNVMAARQWILRTRSGGNGFRAARTIKAGQFASSPSHRWSHSNDAPEISAAACIAPDTVTCVAPCTVTKQESPQRSQGTVAVQVRTLDGSTVLLQRRFQPSDTLRTVMHEFLGQERSTSSAVPSVAALQFVSYFPSRTYDWDALCTTTVEDAGLCPRGTIIFAVKKN